MYDGVRPVAAPFFGLQCRRFGLLSRECNRVEGAVLLIWGTVSGWIRYTATPREGAHKHREGNDGGSLQSSKQLAEKAGQR